MTSTRGEFAFVYDNNNQLINATHPEDIASAFTYDSLGNRITDQFCNFNYDNKKQRLLEDWKYIYAYDNNGNLSSKILKSDNSKVTNFIHNSQNQLIGVKEYNGQVVVNETSYSYDAVGRRVKKEHVDYANSSNSFTRKFQYDNQEILFELDGGNTILSTFTHSGLRTDDVLAVDKSGASYFYLKDHLGTVNDIVDSAGNFVQHYVYSPFGKIVKIENAAGSDITPTPMVDNFYTFTGREYDKESGLYYYRARYYDPALGRFLTVDPDAGTMRNPASFLSKYIYVQNNPVRFVDPNGKIPVILAGIIIGAIVGGTISGFQNGWSLRAVLSGMAAGAVAGGLVGAGAFYGAGIGAGGVGSAGAGAGILGGGALGGAAGGAIGGGLSSFTSAWITGSQWTWGSFLLNTAFCAIGGGVYGAGIGGAAGAINDANLNVGTSLNLTPASPASVPPKPTPQQIPDPNFDRLFQLH